MKIKLLYLLVVSITMLSISGCFSSSSKYYVLNSTAKANKNDYADCSVSIDQVSIPEEVDRPQIIIKVNSNQISVCEFNRWAEPLNSNIGRVIARNLSVLLGSEQVVAVPMASFRPIYRVIIDIQDFGSDLGKSAKIVAVWRVVKTNGDVVISGSSSPRVEITENSFSALAAAHSSALTQISCDIASAIEKDIIK